MESINICEKVEKRLQVKCIPSGIYLNPSKWCFLSLYNSAGTEEKLHQNHLPCLFGTFEVDHCLISWAETSFLEFHLGFNLSFKSLNCCMCCFPAGKYYLTVSLGLKRNNVKSYNSEHEIPESGSQSGRNLN